LRDAWRGLTATPSRDEFEDDAEFEAGKAAALKWRQVKALVESTLTGVQYYHFGYRNYEGGSLETGAVVLALVGRAPSGKVIAIYGRVIWT
jgi:hypothetical protein